MPKYQVKDKVTGKTIIFEGNKPPSRDIVMRELNKIRQGGMDAQSQGMRQTETTPEMNKESARRALESRLGGKTLEEAQSDIQSDIQRNRAGIGLREGAEKAADFVAGGIGGITRGISNLIPGVDYADMVGAAEKTLTPAVGALSGFAEGATFGASNLVPGFSEAQKEIEETPLGGASVLAGDIASAFAPSGAAGLAARGGRAVASGVGKLAGAAGRTGIGRALGTAGKFATEGAIGAGAEGLVRGTIGEGDIDIGRGLEEAGRSALIGGGLSTATGVAGKGIKKFGSEVLADKVNPRASELLSKESIRDIGGTLDRTGVPILGNVRGNITKTISKKSEEISDILSKAETKLPEDVLKKVDVGDIISEISTGIRDRNSKYFKLLEKNGNPALLNPDKIDDQLLNIAEGTQVFKEGKALTDARQIKSFLGKAFEKIAKNPNKAISDEPSAAAKELVTIALSDKLADALGKESGDLADKFRSLNKDIADLIPIEKAITREDVAGKSRFTDLMSTAGGIGLIGLGGGGLAYGEASENAGAGLGGGLAATIGAGMIGRRLMSPEQAQALRGLGRGLSSTRTSATAAPRVGITSNISKLTSDEREKRQPR